MKSFIKQAVIRVSIILLIVLLVGCGSSTNETASLSIAYQYGIGYAPLIIAKELNLIEKHYGSEINIKWQVLNSGSEINEGIIVGEIDVASMGIPPFVTGVSKGIPYKLFSAMSQQPMGLITSNPDLKSLSDFGPSNKISVVSYGSTPHIMLGMAAEKELGDAHALDHLILNMSYPEGMQALISRTVDAHVAAAPYYQMELEQEGISEIKSVSDAFTPNCTFLIGVASEKLFNENRKLYDAVVSAAQEAIDFLNNNTREAAELLCENEGVSLEVMEEYLRSENCRYARLPEGILEIAGFMGRTGFAENVPTTLEEIYFEDLLEYMKE